MPPYILHKAIVRRSMLETKYLKTDRLKNK